MKTFSDLQTGTIQEMKNKGMEDILYLQELPTKRMLEKLPPGMEHINETSILVVCRTWSEHMMTGTEFDILFAHHNVEGYLKVKVLLNFVFVNAAYHTDILPIGHSGICLLDFPGGKPELLEKLVPEGQKIDGVKYDRLYLTNQNVLGRLLGS